MLDRHSPSMSPMIVCVCNRLNETACRETAASGRCRTVGCMYRLHGHRIRCGKCLPSMTEILAAHAPASTPGAGLGAGSAILAAAAPER
jgi:bacterioferritin-associated ferredoxin